MKYMLAKLPMEISLVSLDVPTVRFAGIGDVAMYEGYIHSLTILSMMPSAGVGVLFILMAGGTSWR